MAPFGLLFDRTHLNENFACNSVNVFGPSGTHTAHTHSLTDIGYLLNVTFNRFIRWTTVQSAREFPFCPYYMEIACIHGPLLVQCVYPNGADNALCVCVCAADIFVCLLSTSLASNVIIKVCVRPVQPESSGHAMY